MTPLVMLVAILWLAAYNLIQPLANWISYQALKLPHDSRLGESLAFFLYDVPKILLLLSGMVFVISLIRAFFSPERTRVLLGGKREGVGNVFAALLGIVTPFCSCSAVTLFIGFVESGIPLGVGCCVATPSRPVQGWPFGFVTHPQLLTNKYRGSIVTAIVHQAPVIDRKFSVARSRS
jgi:hypothetical protein